MILAVWRREVRGHPPLGPLVRAAGGAAFALCPRMAEGTRTLAGARAPSTRLQPHDSAPSRSPHLLTPSPWGSGFSARISEGRALSDPSGGDGRGERHRPKISCHDFNPREWPDRAMGSRGTRGSLGRDVCERKAGRVTRPARGRRSRGGRTAGRRRRDLAVAWAPGASVFCPRGAPEGGPQVPTQELRVHRGPRPLGRPGRQLEAGRGEGPRIAHGLRWGDGDTAPPTAFEALPCCLGHGPCGGPLGLGSWHRKAHCSPQKRV